MLKSSHSLLYLLPYCLLLPLDSEPSEARDLAGLNHFCILRGGSGLGTGMEFDRHLFTRINGEPCDLTGLNSSKVTQASRDKSQKSHGEQVTDHNSRSAVLSERLRETRAQKPIEELSEPSQLATQDFTATFSSWPDSAQERLLPCKLLKARELFPSQTRVTPPGGWALWAAALLPPPSLGQTPQGQACLPGPPRLPLPWISPGGARRQGPAYQRREIPGLTLALK